jgi:hypothetical protein
VTLADIGSYYIRYYALWAGVLATAVLALWIFRRRLPRRLRLAGGLIVACLVARLVLFDNPFTLLAYQHALTSENLGLRQGGVLDLEIRKYRREIHQPVLANLAVGSSQVGAIFHQWDSPPPEPVGVYSLAGMKSLDWVLNEDAIAAMHPARVILYVSAFDMTGSPELFSLPLAPPQWRTIPAVYTRLRAAGLTSADMGPSFHGYLASQFLPEFRYSFVYRALIRQWFGAAPRPAAAPGARVPEFSSYYDAQWLEYNFGFLEDFLMFCAAKGIDVLVLEGQINPAAMTPAIAALNATVRERLLGYRARFSTLRYVPADAVYQFTPDEYHDMTHVLPEAARRYTRQLVLRGVLSSR